MHSSNVLKSSVIKTGAKVKAAANKTMGIYDPQLVILLKKQNLQKLKTNMLQKHISTTRLATQKFLANLTGTTKQFITGK
jgi:ABC-type uncharacterized transport system involved in gliding motility auxiliary subunit